MSERAGSIRKGQVILVNGRLLLVTSTEHTKPGKGGAFAQLETKDIKEGTKHPLKLRTEQVIERVILDESKCTYAFTEGDRLVFLDKESFEQFYVPRDVIGENIDFLEEGMEVTVVSYDGSIISVALPMEVTVLIVEADAVVRGQTATASYKPAMLQNGRRILVPQFVKQGDYIIVNTETGDYVRRTKEETE